MGRRRNWFLVKYSSNGSNGIITNFKEHTHLYCPKEFIGKKVRLRLEIIPETKQDNKKYLCKKHGYLVGHKNKEVVLIGGDKMLP